MKIVCIFRLLIQCKSRYWLIRVDSIWLKKLMASLNFRAKIYLISIQNRFLFIRSIFCTTISPYYLVESNQEKWPRQKSFAKYTNRRTTHFRLPNTRHFRSNLLRQRKIHITLTSCAFLWLLFICFVYRWCAKDKSENVTKKWNKKIRFVLMEVHWTTDCHNEMCAIKLLIKRRRKRKKTLYLRFCVVAAATRTCQEYIVLTQARRHKRRSFLYRMDASALILSIRPFATSTEVGRTVCWKNEENIGEERKVPASLSLSPELYVVGTIAVFIQRSNDRETSYRWNSPYVRPRNS